MSSLSDYISKLNKQFVLPPGQGCLYSGDVFILMGLVLATVTGAEAWRDFDQAKAIGTKFYDTLFVMEISLFNKQLSSFSLLTWCFCFWCSPSAQTILVVFINLPLVKLHAAYMYSLTRKRCEQLLLHQAKRNACSLLG